MRGCILASWTSELSVALEPLERSEAFAAGTAEQVVGVVEDADVNSVCAREQHDDPVSPGEAKAVCRQVATPAHSKMLNVTAIA
jgi:hypothetical protein